MGRGRGKHHPLAQMIAFQAACLGGLAARWSFSCGLHGRFNVTRHEIPVPKEKGLPGPLVIAFASDLHAGPTTDPRMFEVLHTAIETEKPDVILLGGDYIS